MGSVQQVGLGLICLFAAFAFGNYVNNHPPKNHAALVDGNTEVAGDGRVQSMLGDSDLVQVQNRPAPIKTMRSPLKDQLAAKSSPESAPGRSEVELPPPSQLNRDDVVEAQSKLNLSANDSGVDQIKKPLIPDFSQIAAEFENSPLTKTLTGPMPVHRNDTNAFQRLKGRQSPQQQKTKSLADIAGTFKGTKGLEPRRPADQSPVEPVHVPDWPRNNKSWFNESDFTPELAQGAGETVFDKPDESQYQGNLDFEAPPNPDGSTLAQNEQVVDAAQFAIGSSSSPFEQRPPLETEFNSQTAEARADLQWGNPREQSVMENSSAPDMGRTNRNPNGVFSRAAIGGIDYDVTPPAPEGYRGNTRMAFSNQSNRQQPSAFGKQERISERTQTLLPRSAAAAGASQLSKLTSRSRQPIELGTSRFGAHRVARGESLQSLSTRYFGQPEYYLDIYLANRDQMRNPNDIREGMNLRIPIFE